MKNCEKNVLAITGQKEMEIHWKRLGQTHRPRELALEPVYPPSTPSARTGRLKIFALLAALTIFLAAGLRPAMAASQENGQPKVPNFSILANDGQTYSPGYLKGNVVLIMFWATWCPYCRHAMPRMNTFANEYANAEFTLLGICGGKDADAWHNYIEEHQLQWPQYLDQDFRMAHLFGAQGVPNFFLIDKDGYLVAHWVGWDDSVRGQVEKLIDYALAMPRRQ